MLIEHDVEPGDIWRACQTKDAPIRDWVKLAVTRARATGAPAIFWLDETRAHDANLIAKVKEYLPEHDTDGLTIEIMPPAEATAYSLERIRRGEDTISVTGNVLRDYNTDLFPILELGTSAQDALGRAADERRRPVRDRRRRLGAQARAAAGQGELPALGQPRRVLRAGRRRSSISPSTPTTPARRSSADTLDRATETFLDEDKSPTRKLGGIDNRGSHFYLALYWAQELAKQTEDAELAAAFAPLAETLAARRADDRRRAASRCRATRPTSAGYYRPDADKADAVMRPSQTLNEALASL